jgi:hypothetical protein
MFCSESHRDPHRNANYFHHRYADKRDKLKKRRDKVLDSVTHFVVVSLRKGESQWCLELSRVGRA